MVATLPMFDAVASASRYGHRIAPAGRRQVDEHRREDEADRVVDEERRQPAAHEHHGDQQPCRLANVRDDRFDQPVRSAASRRLAIRIIIPNSRTMRPVVDGADRRRRAARRSNATIRMAPTIAAAGPIDPQERDPAERDDEVGSEEDEEGGHQRSAAAAARGRRQSTAHVSPAQHVASRDRRALAS